VPYTIATPGSYYLTGTFTGVAGTNGITIAANDVSLDLNGFALIGVPGSLDGISSANFPATYTNLTVRNGIIRNWGGSGVRAFYMYNCTFRDLVVETNGSTGLQAGVTGLIRNCIASQNGGDGIDADSLAVVVECNASYNAFHGFYASGSVVQRCVAYGNGATGIYIFNYSKADHCLASANANDGIALGYYCYATDNTCVLNNPGGSASYGGIRTFYNGGRIEGNHIQYNAGYGIVVGGGGVKWLVIRNSTVGITANAYSIPAGNDVGPWGNAATATSPFANISN
jgi:hypothetical protein